MYIVSACLLGANCKYNGGNNDNEDVKDFCEGHKILAVCPETAGGLKSPRPPAEQIRVCCGDAAKQEGCAVIHGSSTIRQEECTVRQDDNGLVEPECTEEMHVINCEGEDMTEYFRRGAEICMEKVMAACGTPDQRNYEPPELAILKANSPSCGSGCIYDGTFTGTLTKGDGVFAAILKKAGIRVITEEDIVAN